MNIATKTKLTLATIAATGLLSASVWADSNSGAQQSGSGNTAGASQTNQNSQAGAGNSGSGANSNASQKQNAPEGFVLVEEKVVYLTANEPQNHFLRAAEFLNKGDAKSAAAETRIAAAYLDMQAARGGTDNTDSRLSQAADTLRKTADQLAQNNGQNQGQTQNSNQGQNQSGSSTSNPQMNNLSQSFAQANEALAAHFQRLADAGLKASKPIAAGHDLEAAGNSLAAYYAWKQQPIPQQVTSCLNDAARTSAQLLMPGSSGQQNNTSGQSASGGQQSGNQQAGNQQSSNNSMADASKAIDQLGNAIQQAQSSSGQGDKSSSSANSND